MMLWGRVFRLGSEDTGSGMQQVDAAAAAAVSADIRGTIEQAVHAALVELDSVDESLPPRQAAAVLGNLLSAFAGYERQISSVVADATALARAAAADVDELDEEGF